MEPVALIIALAAIVVLATRTHISVIVRKDSTDMATIHEQLDQNTASIAAIQQTLANMPTPAAFDPAPLQQSITALQNDIAALKADVGTEPSA